MKTFISLGIGIVGLLFSAFSGFLFKIAPPTDSLFAVGISSFLLLIIFLLARFLLSKWLTEEERFNIPIYAKKRFKIQIILVSVGFISFLIFGYIYFSTYKTVVYEFKNSKNETVQIVGGYKLTDDAKKQLGENKGIDNKEEIIALYKQALYKKELIWLEKTILEAESNLTYFYIAFVCSLGLSILILSSMLEWIPNNSQTNPDITNANE